jgi:hypothetical protein
MGDGKRAAHSIDAYLRGEYPPAPEVPAAEEKKPKAAAAAG